MGVSGPYPSHCFSPGVFNRSPSSSVKAEIPNSLFLRLKVDAGGEGVLRGADEGAVVPDEPDGTRRFAVRRGVDPKEPSDMSGIVPSD